MEAIAKQNRKKRSRVFETYISKILKRLSPTNGITANSKQQLNSVLCTVSKLICSKVFALTEIAHKKTISEKEVKNAISVLFPSEIALSINNTGQTAIDNFNNKDLSKGVSRQDKACIIFPPAQTEKFLRNFGYSKIMVTSNAPIFLAGGLECFTSLILKEASSLAHSNKRVRVTIRDLELAVRGDKDIDNFFKTSNISFLGGGVQPFIHESLLKKNKKKRNVKKNEDGDKKKHRFRPGTVSIREIRKFQKLSNSLTFAKYPFEKILRESVNKYNNTDNTIKISKDVFTITQYFLEQHLIKIIKNANFAAIHAGRVKLMPVDLEFVSALTLGLENPYASCDQKSLTDKDNILEVFEDEDEILEDDEEVLEEEEEEEDEIVEDEDEIVEEEA
tara:strand:- start:658 stop:1830 length:1173 start_codon:yes stop_codon:yes gene_type:complete